MIKIVVIVISLSILNLIINSLSNKRQQAELEERKNLKDHGIYVVRCPKALKGMFFYAFCLGIIMFSVFLILKLKSNPTVTVGHLIFAAVLVTIGLVGMILATTWRIEASGDEMIIHRLCHSKIQIKMSDIDKVKLVKNKK